MSDPAVCVANVTAAGRRRRLTMGAVVLGATIAATIVLHEGPVTASDLLALPPLAFGWLCVVQALEKT